MLRSVAVVALTLLSLDASAATLRTIQRGVVTLPVGSGAPQTVTVTINPVDKAKFMEATKDVPKLTADQVPLEFVQRIRDIK